MKILLATDGSPCSWHTLEELRRLVPLAAAEVTVVAVAERPTPLSDPIGFDLANVPVMRAAREEAAQALAGFRRTLEAEGIVVHPVQREGDPATEILAVAEALQPDLIALGSHGRGKVLRWVLGSVSQAVVRRWRGPVLVVRQPALETQGGQTIEAVMTARPLCIEASRSLDDAARLMRDHATGFLPVLDGGRLVGVLTDRDVVTRALAAGFNPARTPVGACCTRPAVAVTREMPADEAVLLMERHQIRRVVVTEGPAVVGVVSLGDLAQALPRVAEQALVEITRLEHARRPPR